MQTYLTIEINRGTARARSLPQGFQAAKLWKWEFPRRSSKGPVLSCALRRTPGGTVFLYSDTHPPFAWASPGTRRGPEEPTRAPPAGVSHRRGRIRSLLEHAFLWWVHQRGFRRHVSRACGPDSGIPCSGARGLSPADSPVRGVGGCLSCPSCSGVQACLAPFLPSFSILAALRLWNPSNADGGAGSSCLGCDGKKRPLAFQKPPHSWGRWISIFRGPFSIRTPSSPCLDSTGLV